MSKWYVQIIESECGWGQRVDEELQFDTPEEALAFQKDFNSQNKKLPNNAVPDWYMYATEPFQK